MNRKKFIRAFLYKSPKEKDTVHCWSTEHACIAAPSRSTIATKEVEFTGGSLPSLLPVHVSDSMHLVSTWPTSHSCAMSLLATGTYLFMSGICMSDTREKINCLVCKHKHLSQTSLRPVNMLRNSQHCALAKVESFTFIHPILMLSENRLKDAEFGHCYLGTFILITDALSYCCLVTNTFEIDLLICKILWKDVRVNSLKEKQQWIGKIKIFFTDKIQN